MSYDDYDDGYEPPERKYYVYAEISQDTQAGCVAYQESEHKTKEKDFNDAEYDTEDTADEVAKALSEIFRDTIFTVWSCYWTYDYSCNASDDHDHKDHDKWINGAEVDLVKKTD